MKTTQECEGIVCFIVVLFIVGFFMFAIGNIAGQEAITNDIKQEICKEFMKNTKDYINCNTGKSIDEIIRMIKEEK